MSGIAPRTGKKPCLVTKSRKARTMIQNGELCGTRRRGLLQEALSIGTKGTFVDDRLERYLGREILAGLVTEEVFQLRRYLQWSQGSAQGFNRLIEAERLKMRTIVVRRCLEEID